MGIVYGQTAEDAQEVLDAIKQARIALTRFNDKGNPRMTISDAPLDAIASPVMERRNMFVIKEWEDRTKIAGARL